MNEQGPGVGIVRARHIAAGLGLLLMIVTLPYYLAAGLVAPLWAVIVLVAFWVLLFVLGIAWFRRAPFRVLALPFVAALTWIAVVTLGERLLGWTA